MSEYPEGRTPLTWQDMLPCDKPKGHPSTFEAECKQLRKENALLRQQRDSYRTQLEAADAKADRYATEAEDAEILRRFQVFKLRARVAELEAKIDQMHGLADEGCTAPNAAYRWCERIDEVATHGVQEEYAQYAMSSKRAARPPEATTDPL